MAINIKGIKAGSTTITASYTEGSVTVTSPGVQFTVNPVTPTLTFAVNNTDLTYNGEPQLIGTVTYGGDGQAKYYISTSNTAPAANASGWANVPSDGKIYATNAGTYYVFLQATAGTNYGAVGVKTGNSTGKEIAKKAVGYTATAQTWVYNAATHSASNTASKTSGDLVSGHTASFTCSGSVGPAVTNSGTKTLSTVTIKDANNNDVSSNYNISKTNSTLKITARPINITAASDSKTYDGTALTKNSATAEATGTDRGLVSGHVMTGCTVTGSQTTYGSSNNVPTNATIKTSSSGGTDVTSNYAITYVNGTLSVSKRAVTYKADNQTWVYDGASHTAGNTATLTSGTLPTGHTATITCTGSVGPAVPSSASTKTLSSVVIKNSSNTDVSNSFTITKQNGTLNITKRPITVTAASDSKTYDGTALTNSGATAQANGTNVGLVSGHTMTSCTVSGTQTLAGSKDNVASGAVIKDASSNTVTSNYDITYVKGTLTVNKRNISYTATDESWPYDNSTHNASNTATLTSGSLPSNHTATFTCTGSVGPNTGTATKTLSSVVIKNGSSTDVSSSFNITMSDGTLTISETAITIPTPTNGGGVYKRGAYYATFPAASGASITNYRYSTDNSTWTTTGNTTNPGQTNVGKIYVQAYYTADSNHSGSGWSSSATVEVTAKDVTLNWGTSTWTYNGSAHSTTCTLASGGVISGDTCTVSLSNNSITYVGSVDVTASLSNSNYKISSSSTNPKTISVTKATPALTITGVNQTYTGSAFYAKLTASNAKGTLYWKKGSVPTTSSYGGKVTISTTGSQNTNITSVTNNSDDCQLYWLFVPSSTANSLSSGHTYAENYSNAGGTSSDYVEMTITAAANATVTVTITSGTLVYNGSDQTIATATTSGTSEAKIGYRYGSAATSDSQITWVDVGTALQATNAGVYYIYRKWTADGNHSNSQTYNQVGTYEIDVRPIKVTASSASRAYNGTALTSNSATAETAGTNRGLVSGHQLTGYSVSGSITYVGTTPNQASSAVIKSGSTDVTSNYDIEYVNGTLEITKATPTVSVTGVDQTYTGGAFYAKATVNAKGTLYWKKGSAPTTSSYTGTANISSVNTATNVTYVTDDVDDFRMYWLFVPSSTANSLSSGHTYAENFSSAGGGSSDWTDLTIYPRDIANVTASAANVTYNGTSQTAVVTVTPESGVTITSNDYTISGHTQTNAGTYTITITGQNNYTGSKTISWTINKRNVKVTAGSKSQTYNGSALSYNNASAEAQSGDRGMISSHHLHSYTVSGSRTTAGTTTNTITAATIYNGTHSGSEGNVSTNYEIELVNGTLTVNQFAVTATATSQQKQYDGTKLSAAASGSLNKTLPTNHTITYNCSGEIGPSVSNGTKTLDSVVIKNGGGTDVTSSFNVTLVNGTLEIIRSTSGVITYNPYASASKYCTDSATTSTKTDASKTVTIATSGASSTTNTGVTIAYSVMPSTYNFSIASDGKTITVPVSTSASTYDITVRATAPSSTNYESVYVDKAISIAINPVSLTSLSLVLTSTTVSYGSSTTVSKITAYYTNNASKSVINSASVSASDTTIAQITTT